MSNLNYLILSLSGIGNYLMHTALIHAIKVHQPTATITLWVAPRHTAVLAQANPDIDHVIKAPIKRSLLGHLQQVIRLRHLSPDTGFILYPGQLWKSALYVFLAGAYRRVGHRYMHLGNPDSSLLLTNPVNVNPALHDIDQNLALLQPLSIPIPSALPPYFVTIPTHYQQQAKSLLARVHHSSPAAKIYFGLHPGSAPDFAWKRWPIERYASLAKQIIKKYHAHVLIFGGAQELTLMKNLRRLIGPDHSSIMSAHLLTVAALMKNCQLFIANDSGLMHLSSALSVPTIGLFGPTNERRTGPRGQGSVPLRAPGTAPVYDVNTNYALGSSPHPFMLALNTSPVMAAVENILNQPPAQSS